MSNFAHSLLQLGKTKAWAPSAEQLNLEDSIVSRAWINMSAVQYAPNLLFIYELEQLSDKNSSRRNTFCRDVRLFLGLEEDLEDTLPFSTPGKHWSKTVQNRKDGDKIDICNAVYKPVRTELLGISRRVSRWIRTVFLRSADVHVSSRQYFISLLDAWEQDPCGGDTDFVHFHNFMVKPPH